MSTTLPSPVPHPDGVEECLRFHEVVSADGTRLVGWTNDVDGPPVLVCNGLGVPAYGWPALLTPDCGVRAFGWHHRGLGGSDRPTDVARVDVEHFVEDAVATMDAAGIERCVVAGWSIGVPTMFELTRRHPERVSGLFAVAGVPGDAFASLLGAVPLPRAARRLVGRGTARTLGLVGRPFTGLQRSYDIGPRVGELLSHSGFMLPSEDLGGLRRGVGQFLDMPLDWYMQVAVAVSRYPGVPLQEVTVPTSFVAGRYDVLARAADLRAAAREVPHGEYEELRGSHFITMEKPAEVHRRLRAFVDRVGAS